MRVFGIAGHSGMGKTTLLEHLVPELQSRGLVVSVIRHSHKDLDIDRPGKDSYRLRETGCQEVLLMGRRRWVLMHELSEDVEPPLAQLLDKLQACDLVLIEGFKQGDFPKLEVWRAALDKSPLLPIVPSVIAMATDDPTASLSVPVLNLSDITPIADFIVELAAVQIASLNP
jgi:molybdopterin-guanine dinucleotide biosynthesis adapter protein